METSSSDSDIMSQICRGNQNRNTFVTHLPLNSFLKCEFLKLQKLPSYIPKWKTEKEDWKKDLK